MKQFITNGIEWITDIASHTYVTASILLIVLSLVIWGFVQGWPKEYADNLRLGSSLASFTLAVLLLNDNHRTSEAQQARMLELTKEHPELKDIENKPFEEAEKVKHQKEQ